MAMTPITPPRALLVCLIALAPALQGQTLGLGDHGTLPSLGSFSESDSQIAVNDSNDLFIVFDTWVDDSGTMVRQAEGVFIPFDPSTQTFSVPDSSGVFLLGDPLLHELASFANLEGCLKPQVVSVGTNFVVTWTRMAYNPPNREARLEAAFVEVNPNIDCVVHSKSPGEGFPIVPAWRWWVGHSNANSTLARKSLDILTGSPADDVAVVAFPNLKFGGTTSNSGNTFSNYKIEVWGIDFRNFAALQVPEGTDLLANGGDFAGFRACLDQTTPYGRSPEGGNCPLDLVETLVGDLVLVHDYYLGDRPPFSGLPGEGSIATHLLSWNTSTFTLDWPSPFGWPKRLSGHDSASHQRKASLSTSSPSSSNRIGLSWWEVDENGANGDAHFGVVDLNVPSWTKVNTPPNAGQGFNPQVTFEYPALIFGDNLQRLLLILKEVATGRTTLWAWEPGTPPTTAEEICGTGNPIRPRFAMLEGVGPSVVAIAWNGYASNLQERGRWILFKDF